TLSVVLYAIAFVAACRVRYRNLFPPSATESVLARIAEGLRLVRSDRRLIGTLTVTGVYNVFGWPFTSMVAVIGRDELLVGPGGNRHSVQHARHRCLCWCHPDGDVLPATILPPCLCRGRAALHGDADRLRTGTDAGGCRLSPAVHRSRRCRVQHHAGDFGL